MHFPSFPSLLALGIAFLSAPASAQSCDGFTCNGAGIAKVSGDADCQWACQSCIPGRSSREYYWVREPGMFEQCVCGDDILCTTDLERSRPPPRNEVEITFQCRDGATSSEMVDGPCPRIPPSQRMQSKLSEACGRSGGSWSCSGGSGSGGRPPSRPPPPPPRNEVEITFQCRDGAVSTEMADGPCPRSGSRTMQSRLREACGRSGGSWSCGGGSGSGGRPPSRPTPRGTAQITFQCRDGATSAEMMDTCSCPGRNNGRMKERLREACGRHGGRWSCSASCSEEDESVEAVVLAA